MERISFNDICKAIRQSLIDGNYSPETVEKWDNVYSNGAFTENWIGYIDTISSLCSFLRAVVGVENDTEESVVLYAAHLGFQYR